MRRRHSGRPLRDDRPLAIALTGATHRWRISAASCQLKGGTAEVSRVVSTMATEQRGSVPLAVMCCGQSTNSVVDHTPAVTSVQAEVSSHCGLSRLLPRGLQQHKRRSAQRLWSEWTTPLWRVRLEPTQLLPPRMCSTTTGFLTVVRCPHLGTCKQEVLLLDFG